MRFFTNDARDDADDQENGSHTTADSTVPQQRPGSPWQHTPDSDTTQPVALESSTVAGSAPVPPADDDPERTDRLPDGGDRTVSFADGVTHETPASAGTPGPDTDREGRDIAEEDRDAETPAAAATESTVSGPAPLFPSSDTQPLKERWRDVQLRFVDDPKGATGEAAQLVDEAVDKLITALRDHRGSVAKGADDTESLRWELRGYRDILDRLLGL